MTNLCKMNKKTTIFLLCFILLISLSIRLSYLDKELGGHNSWGERFYSKIGLNYLEKGYLPYFAQVSEYGYYKNHPPLFSIIESLFIALFGISIQVLRLGPLIFSLINTILIFLIINKISKKEIAILVATIYALFPMELYYGFHVDVQGSFLMMFILMSIYFYIKWVNENRFFTPLLVMLTLAMFTDWPAYFLSLFIFLDYLLFEFKKTKNKKIFIIPILVIICFSLFILQYYALSGSFEKVKEELSKSFYFRSYSRDLLPDYGINAKFTIPEFLTKEFGRFKTLFTFPIILLSTFWLINFFIRKIKYKNLEFIERIILIMFFIAFFHIVIFMQGAYIHDFWAYYLIAFLSTTSSLFLFNLLEQTKKVFSVRLMNALLILFLTYFIYSSYLSMQYLLNCKCIL